MLSLKPTFSLSSFTGPITSWQIDGNRQTLFWGGSKITADGHCSHEIKRRLLLRIKTKTNLDSILKSRDITLPTEVRLVKAMVSPVVMYVYEFDYKESWGLKNWCFWTAVLKTLESPLDCKEIQPVHPKGNQSWILIEGLMLKLKLQFFGHLMWRTDSFQEPDAGKDLRREEKGTVEDEVVGWHHQCDGHEFE